MASENHIFKLSNAGGFKAITRYPDMLAGNTVWNPWSPTGAYDALATVNLSANTTSVTFSGIPTGYKHLQLRLFARTDRASNLDGVKINFNGDTAANYSFHLVYGEGASAGAGAISGASGTYGFLGNIAGASQTTGVFGTAVVDILEYGNTNTYKTVRSLCGDDNNSGVNYGFISLSSSNWRSTSAVTSITLDQESGSNFVQYSSFALYGVK